MGKQQSSGCQTPVLLYDWLHFAIDVTHFITSLQWTKYNRWLFFFTEKQNKKKLQRKKTFQRTKLTWRMFGQNWGQHSFWDLYHTWHLKDEVFFFCFYLLFFFFFMYHPPPPLKETSWERYWSVFERHKVVDTMYFLQWRQTTKRERNWTTVA